MKYLIEIKEKRDFFGQKLVKQNWRDFGLLKTVFSDKLLSLMLVQKLKFSCVATVFYSFSACKYLENWSKIEQQGHYKSLFSKGRGQCCIFSRFLALF